MHLCECDVVRAPLCRKSFSLHLYTPMAKHFYSLSLDCISGTLMMY